MDIWKLQLVVVTFIALVQTYQGLTCSAEEDRQLSTGLGDGSLDTGLTDPVVALIKRSKALRFYGLMGKRSATKKSFQVNRRNEGDMFVGLMGRSVSDEPLSRILPAATTAESLMSEEPREQDSQEEWIPILY